MNSLLEQCESWLTCQYKNILALDVSKGPVRLRWLLEGSLTSETAREKANGLVVEDADIGWLVFLLPYDYKHLESQINQALRLRSQLLRESNYSGNSKVGKNEDPDGTWRVGLIWLVQDKQWADWQSQIMELRRESGALEEISVDAVKIKRNEVHTALDLHGMFRLLMHTRALMSRSVTDAEKWLSANAQVSIELENFSEQFDNSRTRIFARELELKMKNFQPSQPSQYSSKAREFRRFRVNNFRNLETLEVMADNTNDTNAQAIVLFGPNGTGKSSFSEAISLAAFKTSPRLEQYLDDRDIQRPTTEDYIKDYLTPLASNVIPSFAWDNYEETPFTLNSAEVSKRRFEGVVLNQEDSIKFTELPREKLAAQVLKGYSSLADHLLEWLLREEIRIKETKLVFTRKYGLNSATKIRATAYKKLAEKLLVEQLQRPGPEFLNWLRFLEQHSDEDGRFASKLVSNWTSQQDNDVTRLAETITKLQELGASETQIAHAIQEKLDEFDQLAKKSGDFRQRIDERIVILRDQLDVALTQIESWGTWLALQSTDRQAPKENSEALEIEIDNIAKERTKLEENGKALRGRLDLLDQARQFLTNHWTGEHTDTCPVCDSNVADREGIKAVVTALQNETNATIQALRARFIEVRNKQNDLELKLKTTGVSICPLAIVDQIRIKNWLNPFLPKNTELEDWLTDSHRREQLKNDLSRMRVLPEVPKPYADSTLVSERLAVKFIALTQEADMALEDPQSISEVKKAFELRLENVLKNHLPSTLEKVWLEITMTLTTAPWLLPVAPELKLDKRGKSLSVQADNKNQYIRYLYNAAERHVLGLAWFFTYYFAKRRFDEAWLLLDDPAQEMDQPSFRELVRLWETMLRIHERKERPITLIVAFHQEERALDATRATNGQLYTLGWKKVQNEKDTHTSVKRVVLLAPGFHPLKPENVFSSNEDSETPVI